MSRMVMVMVVVMVLGDGDGGAGSGQAAWADNQYRLAQPAQYWPRRRTVNISAPAGHKNNNNIISLLADLESEHNITVLVR